VNGEVASSHVDLIHAEHLKTMAMLKDVVGKVPILFDAVDCLSMLESRRRRVTKNPLVMLFSWMESKKLARSEAQASRGFNRLAISSSVDREAFPAAGTTRQRINVIPNGVDLDYFGFRQFEPRANLLVFCAKLDYFPNADAALYFAQSVWPLVRSRRPELKLEIVGNRPPRSVRKLDGRANIRVIASVPDVRPYLGRASVALCPLRIRAGIQNKILEAMALGVPLVATSLCLPGLQVEAGKHLLVADQPGQFTAAIELLLDNPTLRQNLIAEGRAYVERQHNWAVSIEALSNSYNAAMADFSVAGPRSTPTLVVSRDAA
jgi:glycosyltransferase involved in cell wall biosynthesis